jgi:hypothetical protein
MLYDFKPQAVLFGGYISVRSGVTLIDIGHFDRVAGHLLHLLGQRGNLLAVTLFRRA